MDDISKAKPGDTVKINLRGPATEAEIEELREVHENQYPGVKFEFTWDDGPIEVEVVNGNTNDS